MKDKKIWTNQNEIKPHTTCWNPIKTISPLQSVIHLQLSKNAVILRANHMVILIVLFRLIMVVLHFFYHEYKKWKTLIIIHTLVHIIRCLYWFQGLGDFPSLILYTGLYSTLLILFKSGEWLVKVKGGRGEVAGGGGGECRSLYSIRQLVKFG